jgi:predicted DNA-binding transcriptional regulator AlpA
LETRDEEQTVASGEYFRTKDSAFDRPLPPPTDPAPRAVAGVEAAIYVGVSPTLFDQMVKDGRMPIPKRINGRVVWDLLALDEAFEALPDEHGRKGRNAEHSAWEVT